jgi:hypothetical protein
MQSDCSGNSPCQNCAKDGSDCIYVGRKRKRTLQHSAQNQTDHLQAPLASEATIRRTDRPQRDFEAPTTDIPSTISTEFNGMVATEDGHGVDWAAPALYQDPFNTQATVLQNDMVSSFMPAGSAWISSPTFDYSANDDGEIMLNNEAIFDASGSWSNWLPCDQVPTLRNELVSIAAPYSASASQREQASSQRPQGPQAAQSQAHILSPTRTSDTRGLEPAQLEVSTRTMPPVPIVDRHHLRPRPSQSGSKRGLYVAGAGARSTRIDRARRARRKSPKSTNASLDDSPQSHSEASSIFYLHELMDEHALHAEFDAANPLFVTQQNYNGILSKIVDLSSTGVSILHPFSNDRFPSLRTLSYLIQLYFKNFYPVYPFLSEWMIGVPGWGWSMTLATAAIGAQYMDSSISHTSSNALHGLLYSVLVQDVSETS